MTTKTFKDPSPVFDALDTYISGTAYTSSNASATVDGSGTMHTMNCQDPSGNSFTYTERTAGTRVSVAPLSASLGPGQTQQFTATAADASGNPIASPTFTWTVASGGLGTVDATGLYTAPATIAAGATDMVTATLAGQQAWATVTVALHT
jgi:hypothetical protein